MNTSTATLKTCFIKILRQNGIRFYEKKLRSHKICFKIEKAIVEKSDIFYNEQSCCRGVNKFYATNNNRNNNYEKTVQ